MLILIDGTVKKTNCSQVRRKLGDAPLLSHYFLLRHSWPKSTGVLEHCCEGETIVSSPFFGAFTSFRTTKATNDINVHFFTRSSNSCKLYHRIPLLCEATAAYTLTYVLFVYYVFPKYFVPINNEKYMWEMPLTFILILTNTGAWIPMANFVTVTCKHINGVADRGMCADFLRQRPQYRTFYLKISRQ
jgi:hypothetical protein